MHNNGCAGYVGVTDNSWYRFLAARPGMTEVNFWQPSGGREFRVLAPGEPFFFKTHYPHNRLVGGGFFSDSARLRVSEAWELFGEANGVASVEQMRARIGHYRRAPISAGEDPVIGCLFVRDVRFFPGDATAEAPPGFAPNIVQGKSYDLADPIGSAVFLPIFCAGSSAPRWNWTSASHGIGLDRCSATRGWRPTGSASNPSRRSS